MCITNLCSQPTVVAFCYRCKPYTEHPMFLAQAFNNWLHEETLGLSDLSVQSVCTHKSLQYIVTCVAAIRYIVIITYLYILL